MNTAKKLNPIETAVAKLLQQWGVEYDVGYVGESIRDEWKHDRWNVIFKSGKGLEGFEYSTGLGHRVEDQLRAKWARDRYPKNSRALAHALDSTKKPVAPAAAGPLYSMILDSSALYCSFDEWCCDFGYDTDSRKAEAIFDACRSNARKLQRVFTKEQIEALQEALQDY